MQLTSHDIWEAFPHEAFRASLHIVMLCLMRLLEAPSQRLATFTLCDPRGSRSLSRVAGFKQGLLDDNCFGPHSFNISGASIHRLKPSSQPGSLLLDPLSIDNRCCISSSFDWNCLKDW